MRPPPWILAVLALGAAGVDGVAQTTRPADYRALIDAYRGGQRAALDRIRSATEADVRDWIEGARQDRGRTWTVEDRGPPRSRTLTSGLGRSPIDGPSPPSSISAPPRICSSVSETTGRLTRISSSVGEPWCRECLPGSTTPGRRRSSSLAPQSYSRPI